jgi:FlaA1/EpsC-like NDP-sugar epimerase
MGEMMFTNQNVLVIGGTGTIGQAIIKKVIALNPKVVRIYSRDEYKQFMMQDELRHVKNLRFLIGDVRDKERLDRAMHGIDTVFNLAALKHVPACEYNPFEAVQTNVIGTQNVIECAIKNRVKKVIYTSSDKAVSPTNTMGATKLLAERLIASADYTKGGGTPIFAAVRFGNVIGSRGSVIPLWEKQIEGKKVITITEPNMTRFMMSISQAADLVMEAYKQAIGGEVFVLKMPVIRLGDLAKVVIEKHCNKVDISAEDIRIEKIGLRPGEKIYEELMTEQESSESIEYEEMFAILPHHKIEDIHHYENRRPQIKQYSSHLEKAMDIDEIRKLLAETHNI